MLAAVEARATALSDDPELCIAVCRGGLETARVAVREDTEAQRRITAALAAANKELELQRRAAKLRAAVTDLRERMAE
jgi:hypothetical protein